MIAIVGENGAGKTTLVKLLSKMYEPSSGAIFVDDMPLARLPADEWRCASGWGFPGFLSIRISSGADGGFGRCADGWTMRGGHAAVDRAGAGDVMAKLACAASTTQLGATWPGGVELSFGQWQKLALARGFMREEPVLVLDEPTAALDAETEHALFEHYAAAARAPGDKSGRDHHPRLPSLLNGSHG